MKVLFISRRFYPEVIGGGQISALYIAKAVQQQGNEVHVITFSDKEKKEHLIDGIKIHVLKIPILKFFPRLSNMDFMYLQMARLSTPMIKDLKPDIIHLLNWESIPYSSIYYKKKLNMKLVATVNGPNFACFTGNAIDYKGETCIDCQVKKRYKCSIAKWGNTRGTLYYLYSLHFMAMLKDSYSYVDRFFPVSSAMVPVLYNMGVKKYKIAVIHNPVEIKKKVKTDLRKILGLEGKTILFFAGRLTVDKGIQNIIHAIPLLKDTVLIIAGKKVNYFDKLESLSKELKVEKQVIFPGFLEDLSEFYSIADIAVLVEDYYEPLSRFLLEANSYGVPCIVNDIGGNAEIVQDGKNGIVINGKSPEEISFAVKKIMKERKRFSEGCTEVIKGYSPDIIGKKLVENYKEIIG